METAPARSFQDLVVWQKAHGLVIQVYRLTREFPKEEMYGLTSQFRRAAISIPANIAEGFRKQHRPDKLRYMNIAQGSLEECRYYALLTSDLGYADAKPVNNTIEEVSKMLQSYISAIRNSHTASHIQDRNGKNDANKPEGQYP
jgi:four helix bundle protein